MAEEAASAPLRPVEDLIQPFLLEVPNLRGRLVRMGSVVDTILGRHHYPPIVATLLGEMLVLTTLLASMLKLDGVFTLQTKGDGPVRLMVTDIDSEGLLRGYAEFDQTALDQLVRGAPDGGPSAAQLLGYGYLAFTLDQGPETHRYQGVVELTGATLADCVSHYFRQSEQLNAGVKLAAGRIGGGWRAGGLLLQQMPQEPPRETALGSDQEDDWRRALVLMATCSDIELLDPMLPPNDLLFRLFHEEQVRVFEPRLLNAGCRCARERIEAVLGSLPPDEVEAMKVDGSVTVTCQFCNREYRFSDHDLKGLKQS